MKHAKRAAALLLALVMVFVMAAPAWTAGATEASETATSPTTGSITIKDSSTGTVSVAGKTFNAYKILDVKSYTTGTTGENGTEATVVYTVPADMESFYTGRYNLTGNEGDFDAQVVGKINKEPDIFVFAADALAAAKKANIAPKTAQANASDDSVTISDLPLGYYVIEDAGTAAPISALILDTTNPNVEVTIKADKPSVDKWIVETVSGQAGTGSENTENDEENNNENTNQGGNTENDANQDADPVNAITVEESPDEMGEGNGNTNGGDGSETAGDNTNNTSTSKPKYNNAAIGDTVKFEIDSKVPDMTGYTKYYFVLNDTLSKGLTFKDDVAITIGNKTLVEDTDYTVTKTTNTDGTTSVKIVFKNFIQYKDQHGAAITVTYSATVNENAVIENAGNPNKVTLTYSNNPNSDESGNTSDEPGDESPIGETPESTTCTYVTDIELIKVDSEGNRLTGAKFEITGDKLNTVLVRTDVYTENANGAYWKLKDGSYTTTDPNAEGMDQSKYESTTTKYTKSVETTTIEKPENVTYTGTVGADGVLRFEGLAAGIYTITEIEAPRGYNLLKDPITVKIDFTAPTASNADCTWSYTLVDNSNNNSTNAPEANNTDANENVSLEQQTNQIAVINQAGAELPSTGGAGTALFYIVGGILAVGAAVLLVTKRRMRNEDE